MSLGGNNRASAQARRKYRVPTMHCPHCDSGAHARTSQSLSPLYREIVYVCDDATCGHTFVAGLSIVRTLSPSACPNPAITLPVAPARRPALTAANDDGTVRGMPAPANDDKLINTG